MEWDLQEGILRIFEGNFIDPAWTYWGLWLSSWIFTLIGLPGSQFEASRPQDKTGELCLEKSKWELGSRLQEVLVGIYELLLNVQYEREIYQTSSSEAWGSAYVFFCL